MIFGVTNSRVTVAGYFPVSLCNGSIDLVRVQVAAGLSVNQTNLVAVSREAEVLIRTVIRLVAVGVEEPVVVGILVVVAGDLLLLRALGVGLMMGVK